MKNKLFFNLNLQIIFSITFLAMMGVSNVAPAFPKMIEALHLNSEKIGLFISIFTLPGIILAPIIGILADRIGRKIVLVISLAIFAAAGTACFWINDFSILLLLRFLQGVGAVPLSSLNITLLGDLYTGKERSSVMGYNASVLSISNVLYPIIGGSLAVIGWNYPFLLTLLAVPVGIITAFGLKNPEPKREQNLYEYLSSSLKAIKNKEIVLLYLCSTVEFIIFFGVYLVYVPILLGKKFGASPFVIGIMFSIMPIFTAIFSANLGRILKYFSEKTLLKLSYLICGSALLSIPFINNIWILLIPFAVFGIGHGLNFPSIHTLLAELAPMNYRAVFMSLNGMVLRLGQTVGPLLIGLVFAALGMSWVFLGGTILAFLIFILIYIYLK